MSEKSAQATQMFEKNTQATEMFAKSAQAISSMTAPDAPPARVYADVPAAAPLP